jgi:ABC-2 type transport system ATP-binding protein
MSRGMQQKVAIARALLTSPVLLLLDEPTTGLDPRSKKDVQRFVRELRDMHDATVLLTSHDMEEADVLCDRLAILHQGRIVMEGTPLDLKEEYAQRHGSESLPSLEDVFMDVTGRTLTDDEDDEGGGSA